MDNIKNINIFYKGKRFSLNVKDVSFFGKFRGLMFRKFFRDGLLFNFSRGCREPIHSLFVFYPFLALWLNNKNELLEHRIVQPFKFSIVPKKKFYKLIEIPLLVNGKENNKLVNFLVGKERFKYD